MSDFRKVSFNKLDDNSILPTSDFSGKDEVAESINELGSGSGVGIDEVITINPGELEFDDIADRNTINKVVDEIDTKNLLNFITEQSAELQEVSAIAARPENASVRNELSARMDRMDDSVTSAIESASRTIPTNEFTPAPENEPVRITEDSIMGNPSAKTTSIWDNSTPNYFQSHGQGFSNPTNRPNPFSGYQSGSNSTNLSGASSSAIPFPLGQFGHRPATEQGMPEFDVGELSLKKSSRELIVKPHQLNSEQLAALKRRLLDEYRSFVVADANKKITREQKLDTHITIDAPLEKLQEGVAAVRYIEAQAFWTRRAMDIFYVAALGAEILSDFLAFPRFNLSGWADRIKGTTTHTRLVPSLGRLFKQTPWLIRVSSSPITQISIEIMQSMVMYGLQKGSSGAMMTAANSETEAAGLADVSLLHASDT